MIKKKKLKENNIEDSKIYKEQLFTKVLFSGMVKLHKTETKKNF